MQKKQWMLYKVRILGERQFLSNGARKVVDLNLEIVTEITEAEDIAEAIVEIGGNIKAEEVLLTEEKVGQYQGKEIVEEGIIVEVIVMKDNKGEEVEGVDQILTIIIVIIIGGMRKVEGEITEEILPVTPEVHLNNRMITKGIFTFKLYSRELNANLNN